MCRLFCLFRSKNETPKHGDTGDNANPTTVMVGNVAPCGKENVCSLSLSLFSTFSLLSRAWGDNANHDACVVFMHLSAGSTTIPPMPRLTTLPPRVTTALPQRVTPAAVQRTRGSAWMAIRQRVLGRDGYTCRCEDCASAGLVLVAHEVDHITPLADGGTDDDANLRAINRECTNRKKGREAGSRGHGW